MAALFAKLLKRLPSHAQMIFHLCDARPAAFPFLLELALTDFEAEFFAAQAFELLGELFALLGERSGFIPNRGLLLEKSGFATIQFRALFFEARRERFSGGKAFIERGEFGAGRSELVLLGLDRPAKLRQLFHQ